MSGAYAPEMSTDHSPAPRPPTRTARRTDGDQLRSETFWAAFMAAPTDTPRWMDSATAAWRPADAVTSRSAD